jgi:hypothetical protein
MYTLTFSKYYYYESQQVDAREIHVWRYPLTCYVLSSYATEITSKIKLFKSNTNH